MGLLRRKPGRDPPPEGEWPRGPVELDDRSFDDFVAKFPLSAVEFWASWCAPCKAMRPVIRDLAREHQGRVAFGKVNIERHRQLSEDNGVMSIPHVAFFSYGRRLGESRGKLNRRRLEGKLRALSRKVG